MKKKTPWCSCKGGENEIILGEMLCEKKMQKDKFGGSLRDSMMQESKMRKDDDESKLIYF